VLAEKVTSFDKPAMSYLSQLQSFGMSTDQAWAAMDRTLNVQAYLMATDDVLALAGVIMLALIIPIWFARPPFGAAGGAH
jgi:DHA2 family multidrug resistance protein